MTDAGSDVLAARDRGAWLDQMGMSAGLLCAVHCLALPVAVALIPVAGLELVMGEGIEWAFAIVAVALGGLSLVPGCLRVHRRVLPIVLLVLGTSLLLAGRTLVEDESRMETPIVLTGALSMILAHATNAKLCRACRSCTRRRELAESPSV
jgi:hypothetical protein